MMNYFPRIIVYYFLQVIVRTGVEILFNYGFYVLYSDYFFNIMPEQHIWNVFLLLVTCLEKNDHFSFSYRL